MPRATRKTPLPFAPSPGAKNCTLPVQVLNLAAEYEIDPTTLLDWKVYASGKIVLIAANGMKLVREADAGGVHEC